MSLAPSSYFSLYSSPLSRNVHSRQQPPGGAGLLIQSNKLSVSKNGAFLGNWSCCGETQLRKWPNVVTVRASSGTESQTSAAGSSEGGEVEYEEYEVEIEQPYGLRFFKGRDGGTYIDAIAPGSSADKTGMFTVGDKVLATRSSPQFSPQLPQIVFPICLLCILNLLPWCSLECKHFCGLKLLSNVRINYTLVDLYVSRQF